MPGSVIVAAARTPIGRFMGSLKSLEATDLGGIAIRAALDRSGLRPEQVQYVIMGQVVQAGAGQMPARQAAVKAGVPLDVAALTVNKVCLSGMDAIILADQIISTGQFTTVVAGGMESMTNAPHLLTKGRGGLRYGSAELQDALAKDGLDDAFEHLSMAATTDRGNRDRGITRRSQDEFAARSHQRASLAQRNGMFDSELIPVSLPQRDGTTIEFAHDEGIRPDTTHETLSELTPLLGPEGTITAGSSSQISDGAAAVVVMDKQTAQLMKLDWIAEIVGYATVAGPDNSLHSQPSNALNLALSRTGLALSDIELIEINEAFASVAVQSMADLAVSEDIVNVNGGAIALGHPIGMSGTRITVSLALELQRRGGGYGAATICGGGGLGDALILHVPPEM